MNSKYYVIVCILSVNAAKLFFCRGISCLEIKTYDKFHLLKTLLCKFYIIPICATTFKRFKFLKITKSSIIYWDENLCFRRTDIKLLCIIDMLHLVIIHLIHSWIFKCVAVAAARGIAINLIAIFKSNLLRVAIDLNLKITTTFWIFSKNMKK